ncbi:MAG: hypothetical protein QOF92_2923, partial [Pseudonocardiales bacterium]|nr:hypothetical protein [Pseudonocardiales bacterium]
MPADGGGEVVGSADESAAVGAG